MSQENKIEVEKLSTTKGLLPSDGATCSHLRFWLVGWSRIGLQGHHSLTPRGWRYAKSSKAYARMEKAEFRYSLLNDERIRAASKS